MSKVKVISNLVKDLPSTRIDIIRELQSPVVVLEEFLNVLDDHVKASPLKGFIDLFFTVN
jgi:hypothetical protein